MEVVYYVASSLDGYIATADGGVEWLTPFQDGDDDYGFGAFLASVDALLMGSHTYEVAVGFGKWSTPDTPSWVFTSRDLEVAHPSITLTHEDPEAVVDALATRGVKRAWLMGGGQLATSFRERGLITESQVAIIPVVLGDGAPLFARSSGGTPLNLVRCKEHSNGLVLLEYRAAE